MHLAISPVLLGSGEHLLTGLDLLALGYQVEEHATSEAAKEHPTSLSVQNLDP
jgi:hypothetical protein